MSWMGEGVWVGKGKGTAGVEGLELAELGMCWFDKLIGLLVCFIFWLFSLSSLHCFVDASSVRSLLT